MSFGNFTLFPVLYFYPTNTSINVKGKKRIIEKSGKKPIKNNEI